ncbi:hypothetical protein [Pseudomonas sp. Gutcm_11s]|uniref:hypothetical protein n=1 Tax=Pseudomonas sp. Gutcm_11s TaxID=3026088 RepID=UPI00236103FC|nr:hypothetical protein [Pseudomonas sp. Gutcm_11s]MDD0841254.1 hypothetical protein [Pseudomonas sp. Gutcm_11s]
MSKHGKRDILIHFDEDANEIILYTVAAAETKDIRAREFDGARLDTPYMLSMPADEIEKIFGATILSLIDTFSLKKIGIRPYEQLNAERHQREVAEWEIAAKEGDAEAQYMLFIEYHTRVLSLGNAAALELAEQMLEASANQGYADAVRSKEAWPEMRAAAERRLKRGPST